MIGSRTDPRERHAVQIAGWPSEPSVGGDAPFPSANVRRSAPRLSSVNTPPLEQLIDEIMADAYGLTGK